MHHLDKYHKIFIESFAKRHLNENDILRPETPYNHKKPKTDKMLKRATDADQKLGEAILVKWIAGNLRPFFVKDSFFGDFIAHLCNINGDFKYRVAIRLESATRPMRFGRT
jgi:hypothetical protein